MLKTEIMMRINPIKLSERDEQNERNLRYCPFFTDALFVLFIFSSYYIFTYKPY